MKGRELAQVTRGFVASDGDGVRLTRLIGGPDLQMVDPFLLLDCFGSDQPGDYIGGFPDHPHRGFETVTYMLAGRMRHRDSRGHEDVIGPGDLQWMTAGRGLVHSEMPEQSEGLMKGFQLWVNLPAADKMCEPAYRSVRRSEIPAETLDSGGLIKVIAGLTDGGTAGALNIPTVSPIFFDVTLNAAGLFTQAVPPSHRGFIYVIEGSLRLGESVTALETESLGVLGAGDQVLLQAGASGARFLLVAGRALDEPVARYGPFVMNSRQELIQAIEDFQNQDF